MKSFIQFLLICLLPLAIEAQMADYDSAKSNSPGENFAMSIGTKGLSFSGQTISFEALDLMDLHLDRSLSQPYYNPSLEKISIIDIYREPYFVIQNQRGVQTYKTYCGYKHDFSYVFEDENIFPSLFLLVFDAAIPADMRP